MDSRQGAGTEITQCILLKLYKEYADSAFSVWASQRVPGLAALMVGEGPADLLKDMLAAHKQVRAAGMAWLDACGGDMHGTGQE